MQIAMVGEKENNDWQNTVSIYKLPRIHQGTKHEAGVECILNSKLGRKGKPGLTLPAWYLPHLFQHS